MYPLWLESGPDLKLWLGLLWVGYLFWLTGWIVLQKREPVATLSWIMSLALLPIIGLLIYHLFGPTRIRRHRLKRKQARSRVEEMQPGRAWPMRSVR
jgi:cardiolipin synthase